MKSQSRALKLTLRFMGSCAPQPHMCAWRAPTPYDPLLRLFLQKNPDCIILQQ